MDTMGENAVPARQAKMKLGDWPGETILCLAGTDGVTIFRYKF
jgi:hypothetical protein